MIFEQICYLDVWMHKYNPLNLEGLKIISNLFVIIDVIDHAFRRLQRLSELSCYLHLSRSTQENFLLVNGVFLCVLWFFINQGYTLRKVCE